MNDTTTPVKRGRRTRAAMQHAADATILAAARPDDWAAAAAALDREGARPLFRLASALCRYQARSPLAIPVEMDRTAQ